MSKSVSKISVQVPSSLCTDFPDQESDCQVFIHCLIFIFLSLSSFIFFLAAFLLLFFHCPSRFFSSLPFSPVFFPFTLLFTLLSPVWKSLFLAWNWLPYIGSQSTALCQEFSWLLWSTRVREVYFQENAFSIFISASPLHVACVYSIANSSVQEILSDSRITHDSVLHAEAPADTRLLGCFLFTLDDVSWKCCRGSEVALKVSACSYFNYLQLYQTAPLRFGLSREQPLCITSYWSISVAFSILRIKQKSLH